MECKTDTRKSFKQDEQKSPIFKKLEMKNKLLQNRFWLAFISVIFILFSYHSPDKIEKTKSTPDLEVIRKRIINDLLEPSVNEQKIQKLIQSINPDGS